MIIEIHKCQLCGNSWVDTDPKPKESRESLTCPACGSKNIKTLKD